MLPAPVALGLFLCRGVEAVDLQTRVSVKDILSHIRLESVPGTSDPLVAFAVLRGTVGHGTLSIAVYRSDSGDFVFARQRTAVFPDRHYTLYVAIGVGEYVFPAAGEYHFELWIDRDLVAQQRLNGTLGESS